MAGTERKYHLEIQTNGKRAYGFFRSSFRKDGKVMHDTMGTIKGLPVEKLRAMKAAMDGKTINRDNLHITKSREYGASAALFQLAKKIGLDKLIFSRSSELWVKAVLAMIIGRIVFAGSKLALSHVEKLSAIWEICGIEEVIDVDKHCYNPMDELLDRQDLIQKKLVNKHFSDGCVVLYDITSSYLEGAYEDSELADFGYSRDKKRGMKQITIGLICAGNGCPVAVEVFRGNTPDCKTVAGKFELLQKKYGLKKAIFVGDRDMLTQKNLDIAPTDWSTVTALTHAKIKELCNTDKVQLSMFDEDTTTEVVLPEDPSVRYALRKNQVRAEKEKKNRSALIAKVEVELSKISDSKRKSDDAKLGVRVGKILKKYKIGKYFNIVITDGRMSFSRKTEKIDDDAQYDGLYVIRSDISKDDMDIYQVVETYKRLINVEQAFRSMKTTQLELRPIYHRKDDRIKAHVFICMLSYYLLWHMEEALSEFLASDGNGKDRTFTIDYVVETLKSIRAQEVRIDDIDTDTVDVITELTDEQISLLSNIGVAIK
jgi:transposase